MRRRAFSGKERKRFEYVLLESNFLFLSRNTRLVLSAAQNYNEAIFCCVKCRAESVPHFTLLEIFFTVVHSNFSFASGVPTTYVSPPGRPLSAPEFSPPSPKNIYLDKIELQLNNIRKTVIIPFKSIDESHGYKVVRTDPFGA